VATTTVDRTPPTVHLRIGDQKLSTGSGGTHWHVNPCNGKIDATVPLAGKAEIGQANEVAHEAFQGWRRTAPAVRSRLLFRLAGLIEEHAAEFARLGTLDNGMPNGDGYMAVNSADWTRYYAGWTDKLSSDVVGSRTDTGALSYTIGQPYGVIGIIITWNGPLISLAHKVPPAVAAGNTVIVKPSELTPFTGELFADLVAEAGFPAGVINILPGAPEAGEALVSHPLVKKVTFTGGPATGRRILRACADSMKPAVMELGGKSANIIFDDADLDDACERGTIAACGRMSGQGCAFPSRMLVQRTVYEEVVGRVADVARSLVIGDPFTPGVIGGPVINEASLNRILGMIERAQPDGARWSPAVTGSGGSWPTATTSSPLSSPTSTRTRNWRKTRYSDQSLPSRRSTPSRKRSTSPTAPPTDSPATCRLPTSSGPCAWRRNS
jgi:aldehyde dehydrogenase (NAD+)